MQHKYHSVRVSKFDDGKVCLGTFDGFFWSHIRRHLGMVPGDGNAVIFSVFHSGNNEFNVYLKTVKDADALGSDETLFGRENEKRWRYGRGIDCGGHDLHIDPSITLGFFEEDIEFRGGVMLLRNPQIDVYEPRAETAKTADKDVRPDRPPEPLPDQRLVELTHQFNDDHGCKRTPDNVSVLRHNMIVYKGSRRSFDAEGFREYLHGHKFSSPSAMMLENLHTFLAERDAL